MWTEIIALLIAYSGIFAGKYLYKIAKEEVKAGIKNLTALKDILLIGTIVLFFITAPIDMFLKIILAVLFAFMIWVNDYALLGIMFGLNPSFLMGLLILIYGFPAGSLMFRKNAKEIFKKTWIFLVLGLIGILTKTI